MPPCARTGNAAGLGIEYRSRSGGIAAGAAAPTLLHGAPCSVLIARPPCHRDGFPQLVVVGVDGSAAALAALTAARELCARVGCTTRAVQAIADGHADADAAREQLAEWPDIPRVVDERKPVDALCDHEEDIVVVGSRGVRGLRALGSVSERVAHHARSSVLVVR